MQIRTPATARKGDEIAERLGVVLRARVGMHTFQYSDHESQNDDLSGRTNSERDIGDTVPLNRLEMRMFFEAVYAEND